MEDQDASIRLVVELENATIPVAVRANATLDDAFANFAPLKWTPGSKAIYHDGGWRVPTSVPIGDIQLFHGDRLVIDDVRAESSPLPSLGADDQFRVAVLTGRDRGLAWGIGPGQGQHHLKLDGEQLLAGGDEDDPRGIQLRMSEDGAGVEIGCADPFTLALGGRVADDTTVIASAGSAVEVRDGDTGAVLGLEVLRRDEHESSRRRWFRSYRVTASTAALAGSDPLSLQIDGPNLGDRPQLDKEELGMNVVILVAYLLVVLLANVSAFLMVFLLMPLSRVYLQLSRHRRRSRTHDEKLEEWKRSTHAALGAQLGAAVSREIEVMRSRYPAMSELLATVEAMDAGMWNTRQDGRGFLDFFVGYGPWRSSSSVTFRSASTDMASLEALAEELRTVEDAPVAVPLLEQSHVAIVGDLVHVADVARASLLRLMTSHGPTSLVVAVCLPPSPTEVAQLEWMKWSPHLLAPTELLPTGSRIFHTAAEAEKALSSAAIHGETTDSGSGEHLILVVHESSGIDIRVLTEYLRASKRVHLVWVGTVASRVPDVVSSILTLGADASDRGLPASLSDGRTLWVEGLGSDTVEDMVRRLAPLVDDSTNVIDLGIPRLAPVHELVEVQHSSEGEPSSADALRVSLGRDGHGEMVLDLVEDGPHVLVGGTTGSGKSELLRTIILSACARYGPDNASLILIDFKGGAAFADLADLPHVAGSVNSLDSREVGRLIKYLERELYRREERLQAFGGDYGRYRRSGAVGIPRLIVVIDEFAGFRRSSGDAAERDRSLMDLAARGRSLGLHLILATQRPGGSVNAEILANVNARICLRTLDQADSSSVLDSPEAARIPRALPGRAFARLDSGSLQEFQSGWTGEVGDTRSHAQIQRYRLAGRDAGGYSRKEFSASSADLLKLAIIESGVDKDGVDQRSFVPSLMRSVHEAVPVSVQAPTGSIWGYQRDEPDLQRQSDCALDLAAGSVLISAVAGGGKREVLEMLARESVHGGMIAVRATNGANGGWQLPPDLEVDLRNREETTLLIDQLLHHVDYPEPGEFTRIVVCVDDLDMLASVMQSDEQQRSVIRLLTSGPTRGITVIAGVDARIRLPPAITRAFRFVFTGLDTNEAGHFLDPEQRHVRFFRQRNDVSQAVRGEVDRALGPPPDHPAESVGAIDGEGRIWLGLDRLSHQPVQIGLEHHISIVGPPESGRTSTLRILIAAAATIHSRNSLVLGYDGPKLDRGVDLVDRLATHPNSTDWSQELELLDRQLRDGKLSPVVFIDGADEILFKLRRIDATAPSQILDRIDRWSREDLVRLVATGDLTLLTDRTGWKSVFHFARRNFIVLSPDPTQFDTALGGAGFTLRQIVRTRDGQQFSPGLAVVVQRRDRWEVQLPANDVAAD